MSVVHGGPARSTFLTVKGLNDLGVDTQILTKQMLSGEEPVSEESFIHYLSVSPFYYERWGYAKNYSKALEMIPDIDIYHIQELWQYPGYATARCARKSSRPYVVTLHGGMYPEAMKHSSLIKKIALSLFERRLLQEAACTHVTCIEEMEYYRELGFTNPVAVIPNPLEICKIETPALSTGEKRIGYLGRLHPRKRVERLLAVWKNLKEPGELLIIGNGEPDYVAFLKKEAGRMQLSNVRFFGWISGIEKNRLLASLTCLIVPSDFENFGMIVPEALLQEIPVIATTGSPWKELEIYRCGRWVKNDTDTLTEAVREILDLDAKQLREMGERGRKLIIEKYAINRISQQITDMYDWILNRKNKPEFINE
ncbi:hypothetical protein HMPREF1212_02184 [Parabacteroides sp. HGS0025]|nr:hypothetical protein HMPREF1212_02184 [Parabacteroides sp. HGS0025]